MKYQIKQGQEHKFAITENITDEEEFLHPAFEQALYALEKIVTNASGYDPDSDIELYGYSQNIIAFSGVRGMGKTSTMVSLSRAMEVGNLPPKFKSCRFVVLPPVDPTIMEKHQNIVKLLLSRMYRLAEDTWRKAERTNYRNVTEAKKNELLASFNDCLSGLDAINLVAKEPGKATTEIVIRSPKSITSQREIPLFDELWDGLMEYRNRQYEMFDAFGIDFNESTHIFCMPTGKVYDPRTYEDLFKRTLKAAALPGINFHALRHTFATRALEAGMDIKVLSSILGHAQASTTLNLYAHALPDHKRDSMDKMRSFYGVGFDTNEDDDEAC